MNLEKIKETFSHQPAKVLRAQDTGMNCNESSFKKNHTHTKNPQTNRVLCSSRALYIFVIKKLHTKIRHAYSDMLNHLKVFLLHHHDRGQILKKYYLLQTPNLYLFKSNTSKWGRCFPIDKRKEEQNLNSFKKFKTQSPYKKQSLNHSPRITSISFCTTENIQEQVPNRRRLTLN